MSIIMNTDKKVCIVVPVYNAEKYLGYCLNSIISQTYPNWTAILVNDGSTDSSLEICRRYAALDSRFSVIDKPNGGVSSARNAGLAAAEGDYLEFLDSDDCLAHDTIEKQIKLAREYNSQLVCMDIMMVDFSNPDNDRIMLNSGWLGKSPCLLSAEEFREKKMRLIWLTSILECLHAKLYDLSLWKEKGITFPEDLSLGEDFVANMQYFDACNNAVFLHECGHYYNNIMGSASLTQKYRPDLFENKMYLMEKVEEHLGGRENMSAPEKDAFYGYTASSGLTCVEKAVKDSGMDHEGMVRRLKEMYSHELFAESLKYASYIPERLVDCTQPALDGDMEFVIRYIAEDMYSKKPEAQAEEPVPEQPVQASEPVAAVIPESVPEAKPQAKPAAESEPMPAAEPPVPKPGIVNRGIRKIMRTAKSVLGDGTMAERLGRWEGEIAGNGLKYTLKMHAYRNKKVTRFMLDCQTVHLETRLRARIDGVDNDVKSRSAAIEKKTDAIAGIVRDVDARLSAVEANLSSGIGILDDKVNAITENVRNADRKITLIKSREDNNAARIIEIQGEVDTVDSKLGLLYGSVDELKTNIAEEAAAQNAEIAELSGAVEDIRGKVSTSAEKIWDMHNRQVTVAEQVWDMREKLTSTEEKIHDMHNRQVTVAEQVWDMREKLTSTEEKIHDMHNRQVTVAEQVWDMREKIIFSENQLNKLETRIAQLEASLVISYMHEVNELRQRRKAIMLATAEHGNIGDAAITLAEQQFLTEYFPEYYQVEISTYEFEKKHAYLHAILNPSDIIFVNGGGNMGNVYMEEEELHRSIVSEFPNNRIVIFPQTIGFTDTPEGAKEIAKSARIYNSHPDLTLFVRGGESLDFARRHFANVKTYLMPDMVHMLRTKYNFERSGALLCLRADGEKKLTGGDEEAILNAVSGIEGGVERRTNMHTGDVPRHIRGLVVRNELMRFASSRVVITDRLHGMIFAAVTGTPCVVLSSFNHKIGEYYEAFFKDSNAVFFLGADLDKLPSAVEQALNVAHAHYPVFETNSHAALKKIVMGE